MLHAPVCQFTDTRPAATLKDSPNTTIPKLPLPLTPDSLSVIDMLPLIPNLVAPLPTVRSSESVPVIVNRTVPLSEMLKDPAIPTSRIPKKSSVASREILKVPLLTPM